MFSWRGVEPNSVILAMNIADCNRGMKGTEDRLLKFVKMTIARRVKDWKKSNKESPMTFVAQPGMAKSVNRRSMMATRPVPTAANEDNPNTSKSRVSTVSLNTEIALNPCITRETRFIEETPA